MSLTQELMNLSNESRKKMPEPVLAAFAKAAADLAKSGIMDRSIKVGDKVPDFELHNAVGKKVQLYKLLSSGPVVMSFYRGSW